MLIGSFATQQPELKVRNILMQNFKVEYGVDLNVQVTRVFTCSRNLGHVRKGKKYKFTDFFS